VIWNNDPRLVTLIKEKSSATSIIGHEKNIQMLKKRIFEIIFIIKQQVYLKNPKEIYFEIIQNPDIGGFSYSSSNQENEFDFIGINLGTIYAMYNLFSLMLSLPNLLPEMGTPALECKNIYSSGTLQSILSLESPPISPKCSVRKRVAEELAALSFEFVFFHELTHLCNGHLEYLRLDFNQDYLATITDLEKFSKYQSLEMDADSGALMNTLKIGLLRRNSFLQAESKRDVNEQSAVSAIYGSSAKVIKSVMLGAYSVLRIFGDKWDATSQCYKRHPDSIIRCSWLIQLLDTILQRDASILNCRIENLSDGADAIANVEMMFATIKETDEDVHLIIDRIMDPIAKNYYDGLESQWMEILPKLVGYKRCVTRLAHEDMLPATPLP